MINKIAVILGGSSSEREISLKSGSAVAASLERNGFEVVRIDPREEDLHDRIREERPDLAFIVLHGQGGEDGTVQGLLDLMGVPYTGSGVLASALTMNKIYTQTVLAANGILVPEFFGISRGEALALGGEGLARRIREGMGFPVMVKAPSQGSTLGIYFVNKEDRPYEEQLQEALEGCLALEDTVLIEKMIAPSDEITIGILGNERPFALPTLEITTVSGYYDFTSKYTKGLCEHIIPARLPADVRNRAKEIAMRSFQVLGCRGFARADFMVQGDEIYIIDINTIPGFTEMSLLPDAAKAIGISFDQLTRYIVDMALGREFPFLEYQSSLIEG